MIKIREWFTLYRLYFHRNVNRLCNYVFVYQNIVYISYMVHTNLVINYLALPLILIFLKLNFPGSRYSTEFKYGCDRQL